VSASWTIPLVNVGASVATGIWPFDNPNSQTLPDGEYFLFIKVVDRLDNPSSNNSLNSTKYAFKVSRTAPVFYKTDGMET